MPAITTRGVDGLGRDLREAGQALADTRTADEEAAILVGRVAVSMAPRRTGRTAAAVRFGATPVGPSVEVPVPHAVPLHWGAPANHQAAQPWVARAFTAQQDALLTVYEQHVDRVLDRL